MQGLLEHLNPKQLEAVTHQDGPLLIVAGAGTGKTTVITRRIAYLVKENLARPEEILALTFTEKAGGEMQGRVDELLPLGIFDTWISTFHSFCERVLKHCGLDIGLPNDFKILDEIQQWIFVKKHFEEFKLDYYKPLGSPNKFIDALLNHFGKCKDELIKPENYLAYAQKLKLNLDSPELLPPLTPPILGGEEGGILEIKRVNEVASAFHTYQNLLLQNEALDFGDLINYTLKLFQNRPNVLKHYQKRFKFIMVDEFQDTNYAQYQLVKLLSSGPAQAVESASNLVVVGDDDQSIYKFRGASVSNILKFQGDYPQAKKITLVENYRSSQAILDLAYHFIQKNNPNRLENILGINKQLRGQAGLSGEIAVLEGKDLSQELDLVIKKILSLKAEFKDSSWNDFAILVRANAAVDEVLPRLDACAIPYTFLANRGLYKKPLIQLLINYFKLLDNYHESSALYKILQLPQFAIPAEELARITNFAAKKTLSLYEGLAQIRTIPGISETACKKAEKLLSQIHAHTQAAKERSASELLVKLVGDLKIDLLLKPDTLENAENREYLDQFFKKLESFQEKSEDHSLQNFLAELNLEVQAGDTGPIKFDPNLGPESLKILTVHGAKGLEYRFVFVINLVEQRFPTREKKELIEIPNALVKDILPEGDFHLQEERRLFYVAMTRAKTHLYLSWAKDYGGARFKRPSIFLAETNLVPSEKIKLATGKVIFSRPQKTPKSKAVYKTLPEKFSFSAIKTFETCPLEYKYRYYLKLPLPGAPQLSFGKTIHKVLQKFAETYAQASAPQNDLFQIKTSAQPKLPPFSLMEKLYAEHWLDEWYNSKEEKIDYKKLGLKMLEAVYEDFKSRRPQIAYVEKSFSLPLGSFRFEGKIDRVDKLERGVSIVDYKTGKLTKTREQDLNQLKIYQWATQTAGGAKVEKLEYWYLAANQKLAQAAAKPEEIEKLKTELLKTCALIRETILYDKFGKLHARGKNHACNFEDFA